jgi:hypothetical protein
MMLPAHVRETRPFASEVKFIVNAAVGRRIREWARAHLDPDPHGTGPFADEYRTTSLYFDTEAGDVFHRRGSFGRAKYRVRRYGEAQSVFLERKLRRPGILSKRRTVVALDALRHLELGEAAQDWAGEWFRRRLLLRQQKPVCQISYVRMARAGATADGPARLTLDEHLRVSGARGFRFAAEPERTVLEQQLILELKYRQHLPTLFKRLVEEFALSPQRASKYRLGMEALDEAGFPLTLPAAPADGDAPYV